MMNGAHFGRSYRLHSPDQRAFNRPLWSAGLTPRAPRTPRERAEGDGAAQRGQPTWGIVHPFTYARPTSLDAALAHLARKGAAPVGGGTDLLVTMHEDIVRPDELVDVLHLPGAREILVRADGSARIGGAVRIAELAAHDVLRARFPVLAQAARSVGTPALRNMGTLAGNLCQRTRCWYFRRGILCFKSGGTECPARSGEGQYHAIFDGGPCRAVHPSDPAVALAALEATVHIVGNGSARRVLTIAALFHSSAKNPSSETTLASDELIEAVELPAGSAGGTQRYRKLMQRGAWDFALVSLASLKRINGDVRLVLGGVALAPWRVNPSVEEDVASGQLDSESIDALADRALYDAEPLAGNRYKVIQARALLLEAIDELANRT